MSNDLKKRAKGARKQLKKEGGRRAKKARETLESEGTAKRATLFLIGIAGIFAGFLLGRRNRGAIRHATGVAKSKAGRITPGSGRADLNDPALAGKVESEIFRDTGVDKSKVLVNVENDVVYLRGEVASQDQIKALVSGAGKVAGVRGVESLLHLPGEPAPMK